MVAIACSLAPIGCSLLTSLDGLSGGAEPSDATTNAETATAEGSTSDAGGSDSPVVPAEGGDTGEAGPTDPCAGAVLCDDFERTDIKGDWLSAYTDNSGTATLDTSTFTSPTRSLALHVPSSPDAGDPHAQLTSKQYGAVAHARVDFSMKVGTPSRMMSLIRLQLTQTSQKYQFFDLFMLTDKLVVDEQGAGDPSAAYFNYPLQNAFKADTWQRWSMELDATSPPATGVVVIDGTEVLRTTLHNAFVKSSFDVLLGVFYAPNGPPQDVFFDDVSITILP